MTYAALFLSSTAPKIIVAVWGANFAKDRAALISFLDGLDEPCLDDGGDNLWARFTLIIYLHDSASMEEVEAIEAHLRAARSLYWLSETSVQQVQFSAAQALFDLLKPSGHYVKHHVLWLHTSVIPCHPCWWQHITALTAKNAILHLAAASQSPEDSVDPAGALFWVGDPRSNEDLGWSPPTAYWTWLDTLEPESTDSAAEMLFNSLRDFKRPGVWANYQSLAPYIRLGDHVALASSIPGGAKCPSTRNLFYINRDGPAAPER